MFRQMSQRDAERGDKMCLREEETTNQQRQASVRGNYMLL